MNVPDYISENLRFLISEVTLQVSNLQLFLEKPSPDIAKHILDRSGYTYNLKIRIQNACRKILAGKKHSNLIDNRLKALDLIAADLDQIAELCRTCVNNFEPSQFDQSKEILAQQKVLYFKTFNTMLGQVIEQISKIEISIYENNTQFALKIGKPDKKFKNINARLQSQFIHKLKHKKKAQNMMISIRVLSSLTQMGTVLLNISETIISAILGQTINTDRYQSLRHSIEQWWGLPIDKVNIETIAETRSGSGISGITASEGKKGTGYDAIFKDGKKNKLKEEKERVESWHEIYPGLAPKIIDYNKKGNSAAILIEHLQGLTYEKILLNESDELLLKTQRYLEKTLKKVWKRTSSSERISGGYIEQLLKRLDNVYALHPEFKQLNRSICGHPIIAFSSVLKQAKDFETKYALAPFAVYIHGDFNVDNIIFDPLENKINFIDLHRSRYMDYVQDISVFMVSHYRLQVLAPPLRRRILQTAQRFYEFAYQFSVKRKDKTFNVRLALALARSFVTSTRFILDSTLSENMFIRARYLLESVLNTPEDKLKHYQLPINKIFTG